MIWTIETIKLKEIYKHASSQQKKHKKKGKETTSRIEHSSS